MNEIEKNLVSWTTASRKPRQGGHGERQASAAADHSLGASLREQVKELERALEKTTAVRGGMDSSVAHSAEALRRFEQTLVNLRLSLENQRSALRRIESGAEAGEAAARVRAHLMGGSCIADVHSDIRSCVVADLLGEDFQQN